MSNNTKLEPSAEEMKEWLQKAADRIVPFIDSLQTQPVSGGPLPDEIRNKLREPLPQTGQSYDALLKTIFEDVLPYGINLPSSGYLAYIPVGGLFHSVVAELITFAINRWPVRLESWIY